MKDISQRKKPQANRDERHPQESHAEIGIPRQVYVGTSGWAYTSWKPEFYPKEVPAKKFLGYYSARLSSVEVNFTFRAGLKPETSSKWIAATPQGFLFSFKMHQSITHFRRLKDTGEQLEGFFGSLAPFKVAERVGAVLIQLPHNMKADQPLLDAFLGQLPKDNLFAVEFRHPGWLDDQIFSTLRSHNVALCVTEGTDELSIPDISTATFSYYRFRRTPYPTKRINELALQFSDSDKSPIFCYFKHEESPEGALNGVKLLSDLRESS